MSRRRNNRGKKSSPKAKSNSFITTEVTKASNEDIPVSRLRLGEQGSLAISRIQDEARRMLPEELKWPRFIETVECMKQDATVSTALDLKYLFIEKAFNTFNVLYDKKSPESTAAAEFIEFCFKNFDGQTLRQIARDAATFNEYGFSVMEKVYSKVSSGEYAGAWKVSKLGFRPQSSLDPIQPFAISEDNNKILGVNQNPDAFKNPLAWMVNLPNQSQSSTTSIFIPANKCMIMSFGGTDSTPQGVSPLTSCYKSFREKILIENLETIGTTKDLGGVLELKIPSTILQKANQNPSGPDAEFVRGLMNDAANAHAGEQTFFVLPSDTNVNGGKQYEMNLKGVDGSGKQFDTQALINARKKAILDKFGAGFINIGNDSQGSYTLSESKQTVHSHFVQRDIDIIEEAINTDLIPQLLALNNIRLPDNLLPRIKSGKIAEVDRDDFSKYVQRIAAVGFLPLVPEVINQILEVGGIDYRVDLSSTREDLEKIMTKKTTRSGDGLSKVGNGTSDSPATTDTSTLNLEN